MPLARAFARLSAIRRQKWPVGRQIGDFLYKAEFSPLPLPFLVRSFSVP